MPSKTVGATYLLVPIGTISIGLLLEAGKVSDSAESAACNSMLERVCVAAALVLSNVGRERGGRVRSASAARTKCSNLDTWLSSVPLSMLRLTKMQERARMREQETGRRLFHS